jgi:hypothetical protein
VAVVASHLMFRKMRNPKANDAMEELISEVYGTATAAAKDYAASA